MSGTRKVLLIHPHADKAGMPELAEALRRAGAEVEQHFLSDDCSALLDALEGDVLPVVVKG
jgi:hypothetical protein